MTRKFNKCVDIILANEGGYINHPSDPGGETNFGISKRAFPEVDIKHLTKAQAKQIYYELFWMPCKTEQIAPDIAALHIFDFAVNAGKSRAIKIAQRIARVKEDGIIGKITIQAINAQPDFYKAYIQARIDYYTILADKKPSMKIFLNGWLRRVKHITL